MLEDIKEDKNEIMKLEGELPKLQALHWAKSLASNEERFLELVNCLTLFYNYMYFMRINGEQINLKPLKFNLHLNRVFLPENQKTRENEGTISRDS